MNDPVVATLRALLSDSGPSLHADADRCRDRLREALPGQPREVNVLTAAVEQQVVADLLDAGDEETVLLLMDPLAGRLSQGFALAPDAAAWAVRTWAAALEVVSDAALTRRREERRSAQRRFRRPITWVRILLPVALVAVLLASAARWFRPASVRLLAKPVPGVFEPAAENVGEVRAFTAPGLSVRCLAAGPDGQWALTGGPDGSVILWDLARGSGVRRLAGGGAEAVLCAAFSPDGRRALCGMASASAEGPGAILVWNVPGGEQLARLPGHAGGTLCAAFGPDGEHVLSGGKDGVLRLWSLPSGGQVRQFAAPGVADLAIGADPGAPGLALSGDSGGAARLWDLNRGEQVHVLAGPKGAAPAVAFTSAGPRVLTVERLAELQYRVQAWAIRQRPQGTAASAPAGQYEHAVLAEFRTPTGLPAHGPGAAAFAADGSAVIFCEAGGTVHLWHLVGGWEITRFRRSASAAVLLRAERYGALLAGGGFLRLWRLPDRFLRLCVQSTSKWIATVAFSRDGKRLVGWSPEGTVEVWDVATGHRRVPSLQDADAFFTPVRSPDNRRLYTGDDGSVRLWDVKARREVARLEGHRGQVTCVMFSPGFRRALSGGLDGTVRLWDLKPPAAVARFEGHHGEVTSVAFCPDGRLAASAGVDGTVRLWQLILDPGAPGPGPPRTSTHE